MSITIEGYDKAVNTLKQIMSYPKKGASRRTKDGYPLEICYDEFAYKRMVNTYRDAIKDVLVMLGEMEEEK